MKVDIPQYILNGKIDTPLDLKPAINPATTRSNLL